MEYNYIGRITPRRSLVTVHVFEPSVRGRGKPVIALRSCIYIDGERLLSASLFGCSLLHGRFEVLQVLKTKQKWDFACIMKNVGSSPLDCVEILRRSCLSDRGVYHGVLVDYDHSTSLYKLAVGPKVLTLPAAYVKDYNSVRPEILPDSFVCMRFQVLQLSTEVSEDLVLENIYLKISPADSCVMALLTSTPSEHTIQVVGSPSRTESEGVTARRTSVTDLAKMMSQLRANPSPPRIETPQFSNRLFGPGNSPRDRAVQSSPRVETPQFSNRLLEPGHSPRDRAIQSPPRIETPQLLNRSLEPGHSPRDRAIQSPPRIETAQFSNRLLEPGHSLRGRAIQSPPRIETPQLSNRLLELGHSPREIPAEDEYRPLDQLTEHDFFHLSPILSERQIMEDRMRVTVTI